MITVLAVLLTLLLGVFLWVISDWTYASMILLAIAVLFATQDWNEEAVYLVAIVTVVALFHLLRLLRNEE
jgi:hypothetical protein